MKIIRIAGWLLLLLGFGLIVDYSIIQVHSHFDWHKRLMVTPADYDALTKDDLIRTNRQTVDVSRKLIDSLMRNRRQMLWAGLLMLCGAAAVHVSFSAKNQKGPNKTPQVTKD